MGGGGGWGWMVGGEGGGAGCAHVQFYQLSLEYLFIVVGDDSPERPLVHVCGWMGG